MVQFAGSELLKSIIRTKEPYKIYLMGSSSLSLVPGLKVKTASVSHTASVARHPTEDGKEVVDHKVIEARAVQVEGFCADKDAYSSIQLLFSDRKNLYAIQVKELLVENVVFEEFTPSRDPKVLSAIPVSFTMVEVLQTAGTTGLEKDSVKEPRDASTINKGTTSTAQAPADLSRNNEASAIGG